MLVVVANLSNLIPRPLSGNETTEPYNIIVSFPMPRSLGMRLVANTYITE